VQPALPAPQSLAGRVAAFTEGGLMRAGGDFENGLPNQNVSAGATTAVFNPSAAGAGRATSLAYAVYSFAVQDYDRDINLQLAWDTPPASGQGWVALANFSTNHWDWFALPDSGKVDLDSLAPYTSPAPEYKLFAAVLLTGQASSTLDEVRIGTQPAPGDPTASLVVTPDIGLTPLDVAFDASASTAVAPATIAKYEFDFGEGAGFADNGATPTAGHTYRSNGTFTAQVRVTDVFGATATASHQLRVGISPNYDEVEPNDDYTTPCPLPAFPFTGFRGNIGTAGPYNGGTDDYLSFQSQAGQTVGFTLTYPANALVEIVLVDSDDNFLEFGTNNGNTASVVYTVEPSDVQPLMVDVYDFGDDSVDYTLSGALNPPAAVLTATPSKAPAAPQQVLLDASGSSDPAPGHIVTYEFDPEGDGTFQAPQAGATLQYTYTAEGVYLPEVRVTDDEGLTSVAQASVVVGSFYDETENNDDLDSANPLPALPVHGFRGSIGSGAGYEAYDGDTDDFFSFNAAQGDTIDLKLHLDADTCYGSVALYDDLGNVLASSAGGTALEEVNYTVTQFDTAPFYADVTGFGYCDYTLDVALNPPVAALTAAPDHGDPPLDVVLDASGSTDAPPGSIQTYEFDPIGDGSFQAPQAGATFEYTYAAAGVYSPVVRVTDDEGNSSTATVFVLVGVNYSEQEPNNDGPTAQHFPAFPFSAFTGSQGSGPGYRGYDGGPWDLFTFNSASGHEFKFTNTYDNSTGELDFELQDQFGDDILDTYGSGGSNVLDYTTGSDPNDFGGPYYLYVWDHTGDHYGDYSLDGVKVH
jgi:hypothetical protein